MVSGDPYADEIVILWETSAACKNSSSLRYTSESKCYHIHTYDDNGLRANFIDLTSLIRPRGYKVIYSQDKRYKFLFSVCKPLAFSASDSDHPAQCNGHMACLVAAPGSSVGGVALPLVIGSGTSRRDSRLYMASGLLTLKYYNITGVSGTCGMKRNIKIHFLCPTSNQVSNLKQFQSSSYIPVCYFIGIGTSCHVFGSRSLSHHRHMVHLLCMRSSSYPSLRLCP